MATALPRFLYDSDCGLCTRLKSAASFLDASHSVDFVPIHEAAQQGLLSSVPENEWFACSRLILPDGTTSSGGEAMVGLLSLLPGGWAPALLISRAPFGLPAARAVYGVLSRLHSYSCSTGITSTQLSIHAAGFEL